jgi:hypothetical protein
MQHDLTLYVRVDSVAFDHDGAPRAPAGTGQRRATLGL